MKIDEAAEAEWVRAAVTRYAGPLTRYAALITGDLERARDVVQDTFVRLCADNSPLGLGRRIRAGDKLTLAASDRALPCGR